MAPAHLAAFTGRQASPVNDAQAYAVPLREALTIDARQDFTVALMKLCKSDASS